MLVLTRKDGQGLVIGDDIEVVVLESRKGKVKIGIKARPTVRVYRSEAANSNQETQKKEEESADVHRIAG